MINKLTNVVLGIIFSTTAFMSSAQCPVITCSADTVSYNDSSMCDAIVYFALPTAIDTCSPTGSQLFTFTGAQEMFTVPAGVTSITVDAYGAQGGANYPSNTNYGGYVQADIAVTPGMTLYIYVGEQPTGLTGGFNGGGNGETAGIGGGGASDVRIGGTTYADRVVVAGGAGGGGYWSSQEIFGGLGGGLVGGTGYRSTIATIGGDPGTQVATGNGTCVSFNNPICTGGFGYGGAPSGCGCEGYGGGGGWYGGGGSGNCRGGGGGSSYTDPSATNVTHAQGVRVGHGEITLTWGGGAILPTITQIGGITSGSVFPLGTTVNTFVAESFGGADTCSFSITVVDNENPTITCSGDYAICEGSILSGTSPTTADNCLGETVAYSLSGATTGTGSGNIDGVSFNPGTTVVSYIVADASGNVDTCMFNVVVTPNPTVSLAPFSTDSLCDYNAAIALPAGSPLAGIYSGSGVSGANFDPSIANNGTNWITYTYIDSMGCMNSDSSAIYVDGCADLSEGFLPTEISVYPNPTSGKVQVLGDFKGLTNFTITTIDGRLLARKLNHEGSTVTIDLSREPNGVYLILIEHKSESRVLKIIKE